MIGTVLNDRFRVESLIGEGGMASVYLARDLHLGREVVVKVPHAHLMATRTARERFLHEVKHMVRLEHPYVLDILDSGEFEGRPFAVMRYLPGGSLEERLAKHGWRLPPEDLAEWLPALAETLDFLHARGLLHRDIKPANVLFDGSGRPCLADFGIATALGEHGTGGGGDSLQLTRAGTVVGSPAYMPPEAVNREFGPAYDQYALGVIAYLALSGELPHQAETAEAMLVSKKTEAPIPLSRRAPDLPAACASAVMRAIAGNPADRFPTCAQFADAFLHGLRQRSRRRPSLRFAVAVAALAALAGIVALAPRDSLLELLRGLSGREGTAGVRVRVAGARLLMGSTPEEVERALALCRRYEARCERSWYASEQPRAVRVQPFSIDRREVTNAEFARFVESTGHRTTAEELGYSFESSLRVDGLDWRRPAGPASSYRGLPRRPVAHVSLRDAAAYCAKLGMRLPTEAEWELAARGADRRIFPWGDEWDERNASWLSGAEPRLPESGSHPGGATPRGVEDLAGSVWEWTSTSDGDAQVLKGGSFLESNPANLRGAVRMLDNPDLTSSDVGFRCASGD